MYKTILLSCLCIPLLHAHAEQFDDLSSLSLEKLLNIEVTSVSKRSEQQQFAPGVVTIISSKEIKQYGARHLRDVIDRVVGAQILSSHQRPHNKTSIRAMNGAHQDGSVLVLVNGRPVHDGTDGGFNFDLYLGFPLETIEHIEIVRGPGSVIYGTNAMAGVINIVTKDAHSSINKNIVKLNAGSFNRRQIELSTLIGDIDYSLNIGLNSIRSHGESVDGVIDKDGIAGKYDTGESSDNLFVNYHTENFALNAIYMDNDQDSGGSAFQLPSSSMKKERYFIDAGYLYNITSGWDASFNYTLNIGEFEWQINEAKGRNHYEDRYDMAELVVRGNFKNNLNLLFGLNHSRYKTAFDLGFPSSKISNSSAYAQIDYMPSDRQKLIAGIQWNKPKEINSDISSRVGFIQGIGDNWWLKLLYSEAYRSPNLQEAKIDAPTLKGNPMLDPEKVSTYDAQIIYQSTGYYFALSLYDSKLDNVIVRVPGSPTTFTNQGYLEFQGVELEGRVEINKDLNLQANLSYQTNETDDGIKDSTFAPNVMAKVGASYSGFHGVDISLFNSYIGESTDLTVTHSIDQKNQKADSYNLLTANISMDIYKLFKVGKPGSSTVSIYLDNILDERIYTPNLNYANGSDTIPHHWGRGVNISYSYNF